MMGFDGRVALVTGSGQGIGLATAKRLAAEGAAVVICDLDSSVAANAAAEIRDELGAKTLSVGCDVGDEIAVEKMVQTATAEFGTVDILVNNAGITRDNLLFKMSVEDWEQVMRVHLRGAFLCTRAVQKGMVERRFGKIVNTSSTSALGNRGQCNYSTAKAGIQAFTRTAALELGPFGINVNAVAPGFIDTEMTRESATRRGLNPEELKKQKAAGVPLRRVGTPRDVASVIAFLCSEDAAYVSGQIIYVKGGPETKR